MIKVALSGSTGLIGTRINELLANEFNFIPLLQSEVDIADKEQTHKAINGMDFDIFLHLAAYTNVDAAEKDKDTVYKVNVEGTKNVFDAVTAKNKKFIYISTDFIFDGTNPPYDEDSKPNPLGYYAQTKYEGEQLVKENSMIIRLAYPYRAKFDQKKDFVRSIISLLKSKTQLQMVTDSSITPTFIDDIIFGLKHCFLNFSPRIIHLVGANSVSPYDASLLIAETFNLDKSLISPTTFAEYSKLKAKRPQYSEIITKHNTFYKMKPFDVGLRTIKNQIEN